MTDSAADVFRAEMSGAPAVPDAVRAEPDAFGEPAVATFDDIGPDSPVDALAAPAETVKPAAAPKEPDEPGNGMVPSWRLRELREEREREAQRASAYERELAELREFKRQQEAAKQTAPDFFEKPDGFVDHRLQERLSPIEQRMQEMQERAEARFLASDFARVVDKHGEDEVNKALQWAASNPALVQQFKGHPISPHGAMMDAFRRETLFREFGADPKTARQKIADELLDDPEFAQRFMERQRSGARPVIEGPQPARAANGQFKSLPSMNRTTGAGSVDDDGSPGDVFRQSLAAPRGR